MRLIKLLLLPAALALFSGCFAAVRERKPARAPAAPARAKKQPSAEELKKVEQLYYQAVDAYGRDDLAGSERFLQEIFRLDPAYPPAKELREKLKLAGKKPGAR